MNSKFDVTSWWARDSGKGCSFAGRIFSLGVLSLCSTKVSTNWMMRHIMKGDLPYSKCVNSNVNFKQENTFTKTSSIMFDQMSWHHGSANLNA